MRYRQPPAHFRGSLAFRLASPHIAALASLQRVRIHLSSLQMRLRLVQPWSTASSTFSFSFNSNCLTEFGRAKMPCPGSWKQLSTCCCGTPSRVLACSRSTSHFWSGQVGIHLKPTCEVVQIMYVCIYIHSIQIAPVHFLAAHARCHQGWP